MHLLPHLGISRVAHLPYIGAVKRREAGSGAKRSGEEWSGEEKSEVTRRGAERKGKRERESKRERKSNLRAR